MLEVDVDVRGLAALFGDETGKEQVLIVLGRIDRSHAQAKADAGIGRRAAALAEDVLVPRPADDVMDGEEIVGEAELLDQVELVLDGPPFFVAHPFFETPLRALPGQVGQVLDRGLPGRHRFVGILVLELSKVELDPLGDLKAALHRAGEAGEEPGHFGGRFQMPLAVGLQPQAGVMDGAGLADAGQHVLQVPAVRAVIEDVVGGEHRRAGGLGQGRQPREPVQVARAIGPRRRQPDVAAQVAGDLAQAAFEVFIQPGGRDHQDKLAFGMVGEVGPAQVALALLRAKLADGQQPGQAAVGFAVGGVAEQRRRIVGEVQPAPGQRLHRQRRLAQLLHLRPGPHHPSQRIAVGDADGFHAQHAGLVDQFMGMRGSAQEREIGGGLEFGVAGHAQTPSVALCAPPPPEGEDL